MSYIIAISSSKGGPGKTNTVANLADYWALKGKKVAMLDSDPNKNLSKWYNKKALDDAVDLLMQLFLDRIERLVDHRVPIDLQGATVRKPQGTVQGRPAHRFRIQVM